MKCNQCGYESEQVFPTCPSCGMQSQPVNTAAAKILPALKDPLFLVLCILMSVSCLFGMASGNFSVITVLLTVFLWLSYAGARKDKLPTNHLRFISGTVFAQYVIVYVIAGLFLLLGVVFALVFNALVDDTELMQGILSGFITSPADLAIFTEALGMISGGVVVVIFGLISILLVVINVFSMRYYHGFAQSVYKSLESGTLALKYVKASRAWFIVTAVCTGFSVLSSLLGSGADAALGSNSTNLGIVLMCILLINKHLMPEE